MNKIKLKMKKWVFFIIVGIPILSGCKREVPNAIPNASFAKIYTLEGNQRVMGSTKAPDGGYLLWGSSVDIATKDPNGFLMKLDANQNLVWHKMVGGNRRDEIRSACYDNAGNIMATGMSVSFDNANRKGEFHSMLTVYLSGNGDVIWEKYYTAPSTAPNLSTVANKILYLPNGNFALVGTTNNYKSKLLYINAINEVSRPFILTINNKGDTIGTSSYDVLLEDRAIGRSYFNAIGINALLAKDGNILLFVVRQNYYADSASKTLARSLGNFESGVTLIKINPTIHTGYNNYTWKRTIPNMKVYLEFFDNNGFVIDYNAFFYQMPFKLMDTPEEQFFIGFPAMNDRYLDYAIFNKDGDLISNAIPSTELQPYPCDVEYNDGSIFLLSSVSFSKLNMNGKIEWTNNIQSTFKTRTISGIYLQEDKSVLIFCSSLNSKSDLDIGCIKFNDLGEVLTK